MSDKRIPFTKHDEDRIASASLWGGIAAVTTMAAVAIDTGIAVVMKAPWQQLLRQGITLVIAVLLGIWLLQACRAFHKVARTDIADKAYMRAGFAALHKHFLLAGVAMIVAIIFIAVMVVLSLVLGMGGAGGGGVLRF